MIVMESDLSRLFAEKREPAVLRSGAGLWLVFFLMCMGLGYPTLSRYDPRTTGNTDSAQYYSIVIYGPTALEGHRGFRVLVPYLAKPFYFLAKGRLGSWDPVFFGLLVANSIFTAATAFLLVRIGRAELGDYTLALIGAMTYLLNFATVNFNLAGMVDAGEGFFLMALVWTLLRGRWRLLPVLGFFGALAKETFVPVSFVFASTWWIAARRQNGIQFSRAGWITALGGTGVLTVTILQSVVSGHAVWPWQFAASLHSGPNYVLSLLRCLLDRNVWYVFVWLFPLGVWRLHYLPPPWVQASLVTAIVALGLGAYRQSQGNVARAVFNVAGPLFSLSMAHFLSNPAISLGRSCTRRPTSPIDKAHDRL